MGEDVLESKMEEVALDKETTYEPVPFGKEILRHFLFAPGYVNLNHGSFGTFPREIREIQRAYHEDVESAPDAFIRYKWFNLLRDNRAAAAKVVNARLETVVFVPNATTGVNTILRNIVWNKDGKDEILYFMHIYGACLKTVAYVCEANHNIVNPREIIIKYPIEDAEVFSTFREAIKASRAAGKNPRVAIFDTVTSLPGLRMPFEGLTDICKQEGILSLIDGAHGVGHVHLDLTTLDPDFFVSNLHKWLFVPRGCAILYVPLRNQPMMRTSLPTSHGFVPRGTTQRVSPLGAGPSNEFVANHEYVGTIDNANYCVVRDAIRWREQVCGGEKAIIEHNMKLAKEGGQAVAKILGTKILDNASGTMTQCCLVNVLLPIKCGDEKVDGWYTVKSEYESAATTWMQKTMIVERKMSMVIYKFQGQTWVRLSGQVYLDLSDFERAGHELKAVCERAENEEFLKK